MGIKSTPKSPRKTVQIVESKRIGYKVKQRIVKYIGVATNDEELEELKLLANKFKAELEYSRQLPLYTPQELERLQLRQQKDKAIDKNNLNQIKDNKNIIN